MTSATISSLSEFLLHAGTDYRLFDLGRGVTPIENQTFFDLESAAQPAPNPRQQKAWFAVLFWHGQAATQHYIWFLSFPLDERGCLMPAARDQFLQIVIEALEKQAKKPDELPENPYTFQPPQNLLAQFNAYSRKYLALSPSQHLATVQNYFTEPQSFDWQALPVQGIHDLGVRLDDSKLAQQISEQFEHYAPEALQALLQASENITLADELLERLYAELAKGLTPHNEPRLDLAMLRAISHPEQQARIQKLLAGILNSPVAALDTDTLSVIAARHANQFDHALTKLYFERVAQADNALNMQGELFAGLFSDLVQLPCCRINVLTLLRDEQRSQQLSMAIEQLFKRTKGAH